MMPYLVVNVSTPREKEGQVEAWVSARGGVEARENAGQLQQHHHTRAIAVCSPCQLLEKR